MAARRDTAGRVAGRVNVVKAAVRVETAQAEIVRQAAVAHKGDAKAAGASVVIEESAAVIEGASKVRLKSILKN